MKCGIRASANVSLMLGITPPPFNGPGPDPARIPSSDLVLVPDFMDFGPSKAIIIPWDQLIKTKMGIRFDFDYDF